MRTAPVWAEAFGIGERKMVNVARDLKTAVMRRYRALLTAHGSASAALLQFLSRVAIEDAWDSA